MSYQLDYRRLDEINDEIEYLMLENAKTGKFEKLLKSTIKKRDNWIKQIDIYHWWDHEKKRLDKKLDASIERRLKMTRKKAIEILGPNTSEEIQVKKNSKNL